MANQPINYTPPPRPFSRLAIAACLWLFLILPIAFAAKACVFDSTWFINPYLVVTTRTASDPGTWYTRLSPYEWFFVILFALELTGFILGLLAVQNVRSQNLRGRGMALNAMFIPVCMAVITVMAFGVVDILDWRWGS